MSKIPITGSILLCWAAAVAGEGMSPKAALERLKGLEGKWEGHVTTADGPRGSVEYRVTSGGNTVMEFLFPGSDHEMVSVFYLDGGELVAKHYCVMGNQPEMKLDRSSSSENELHFVFSGGTNLDPNKDPHIHSGKIAIRGERLENEWDVFSNGKKEGANRFFLSRAKD